MNKHYGDGGLTRLLNGSIITKGSNAIKIEAKLDLISALIQEILTSGNNVVLEPLSKTLAMVTNLLIYFSSHDDKMLIELREFVGEMDRFVGTHKNIVGFQLFKNPLSCKVNILRTTIREFECLLVEENNKNRMSDIILTFVNRLSLYLFYLSCDVN